MLATVTLPDSLARKVCRKAFRDHCERDRLGELSRTFLRGESQKLIGLSPADEYREERRARKHGFAGSGIPRCIAPQACEILAADNFGGTPMRSHGLTYAYQVDVRYADSGACALYGVTVDGDLILWAN